MPVNDLSLLAAEVHADNAHWWRNPATGAKIERDKDLLIFLMISEIVEAGEGERKSLKDPHLPDRSVAEVELADALIRLFDYVGAFNYDLDAFIAKNFPSCRDKTLNGMKRYFAYRQFTRAQKKPTQLLMMIQSLSRVAELEGIAPSRDIESQLVWFLHLVMDYCAVWEYDIEGAFYAKRLYNKTRLDHTDAARMGPGGKKW